MSACQAQAIAGRLTTAIGMQEFTVFELILVWLLKTVAQSGCLLFPGSRQQATFRRLRIVFTAT